MILNNDMAIYVAKRRWLKRIFKSWLPETAYFTFDNGSKFYVDPKDMCGPSFHAAYDGQKGFENYEEDAKNALLHLLAPNGVFFDIGANIGLYSTYFHHKKPEAEIFAFEPNELAFKCLSHNLPASDRVHLINKAVGNVEEEKKLYSSHINDGGHTFAFEQHNHDKSADDFQIVPVVNLDKMHEKGEIPLPSVIKIDVEGFELEVLNGMTEIINKARPHMLIECDNWDLMKKASLYQKLNSFPNIKAKVPGSTRYISIDELSHHAAKQITANNPLSNYFFHFIGHGES